MGEQCATCGVKAEATADWSTILCENFCSYFIHDRSEKCVTEFIKSKMGLGALKIVEGESFDTIGLSNLALRIKCDCGAPYYKYRWGRREATADISEWDNFDECFKYRIGRVVRSTMDDIINKVVPRPSTKWAYVDNAITSLKYISFTQLNRFAKDVEMGKILTWNMLPRMIRYFIPRTDGTPTVLAKLNYLIDIKTNRIAVVKRIRELVDTEVDKYVVERGA